MTVSMNPPQETSQDFKPYSVAGQVVFRRSLSKNLVRHSKMIHFGNPPPHPAARVLSTRFTTTASDNRSIVLQVFVDLEISDDAALALSRNFKATIPGLELVISVRNGATADDIEMWRHTVRWVHRLGIFHVAYQHTAYSSIEINLKAKKSS